MKFLCKVILHFHLKFLGTRDGVTYNAEKYASFTEGNNIRTTIALVKKKTIDKRK